MSRKTHDLCVATSSYTQNGQKKNRYENIGFIMEGDDGSSFGMLKAYINLADLPRKEGSEFIPVRFFPVKDNNSQQSGNTKSNSSSQEPWDGNINATDNNGGFPF